MVKKVLPARDFLDIMAHVFIKISEKVFICSNCGFEEITMKSAI